MWQVFGNLKLKWNGFLTKSEIETGLARIGATKAVISKEEFGMLTERFGSTDSSTNRVGYPI